MAAMGLNNSADNGKSEPSAFKLSVVVGSSRKAFKNFDLIRFGNALPCIPYPKSQHTVGGNRTQSNGVAGLGMANGILNKIHHRLGKSLAIHNHWIQPFGL